MGVEEKTGLARRKPFYGYYALGRFHIITLLWTALGILIAKLFGKDEEEESGEEEEIYPKKKEEDLENEEGEDDKDDSSPLG